MEYSFGTRLKHAWNAFLNRDPTDYFKDVGISSSYRPDRVRLSGGNERSIVTSVYNRISLDAAAINIVHARLDENNRFVESIDSGLNNCLNIEANIDQTGRAFIQDVVMSMLDEGCVAMVPIDTTIDPAVTSSYDISTMRTGKILEWRPNNVKVRVYNDRTGTKEDIMVPKKTTAIIENPLYAVINEPNSTMQRLIRKLNLLDAVDEQSGSGKLDLIIQLPYIVKTEARRQQAEKRRKEIEKQLTNSKYGIAYTDSTEHITQLNRSVENNLMSQIEYLTSMLYSQLGITTSILDGTADEKTMLNYYNRTIEPIVSAITDEMKRKFLTKTARSQMQSIVFFRDPFKLVPVNDIAEIADKFTRNEIMTSNEIRQIIGMKPSKDPKADELRNSNISQSKEEIASQVSANPYEEETEEDISQEEPMSEEEYLKQIKELDDLDSQLDDLEKDLGNNSLKHYASPYYDPVKAHEYYERTKELKGRKSTSRLNDEGKAAARYVKEQLTTERKTKVQNHSDQTNLQIDAAKSQMDARVEAEKNSMNAQIESQKNQKNAKVEAEKNSMNAQIESHKKLMNQQIESLQTKLKNMSAAQKAANSEKIQSQIDKLREDNNEVRERLQNEYKSAKSGFENDYKNAKSGLQSDYKSTKEGLRGEYTNTRTNLRNAHKEEKTRLKDEYDEKYLQELDKIKSNSKFLKTTKRKKKS